MLSYLSNGGWREAEVQRVINFGAGNENRFPISSLEIGLGSQMPTLFRFSLRSVFHSSWRFQNSQMNRLSLEWWLYPRLFEPTMSLMASNKLDRFLSNSQVLFVILMNQLKQLMWNPKCDPWLVFKASEKFLYLRVSFFKARVCIVEPEAQNLCFSTEFRKNSNFGRNGFKKGFELELGLELFQIFFLTAKKIRVQGFSNFSDLVGELFL